MPNPYKTKALQIPIEGPCPQLALEVRRLLGWTGDDRPFLSTRQAARKIGVSNGTIASLAAGDRVSFETLIKLAQGTGVHPNSLLVVAGYPQIIDGGEVVKATATIEDEWCDFAVRLRTADEATQNAARKVLKGLLE